MLPEKIEAVYNKGMFKRTGITWHMDRWCNYKCSYCRQLDDKQDSLDVVNKKLLVMAERVNDELIKIKKNNPENLIALSLIGGELTYFDLESVFKKLTIVPDEVNITTNLSNTKKRYEEIYNILKSFGVDRYKITASLHDEYVKDIPAFIQKLSEIKCDSKQLQFVVDATNKNNLENYKILKEEILKYPDIRSKIDLNLNDNIPEGIELPKKKLETRQTRIIYDNDKVADDSRTAILLASTDIDKSPLFKTIGMLCASSNLCISFEGEITYFRCQHADMHTNKIICNKKECSLCGNYGVFKNEAAYKKAAELSNIPKFKPLPENTSLI